MPFTEAIAAELDRIGQLDDEFQQGYQSAPLLCQMNDIGAADLLCSVLANPSTDEDHKQRDAGVIKWCVEQLEKQQ